MKAVDRAVRGSCQSDMQDLNVPKDIGSDDVKRGGVRIGSCHKMASSRRLSNQSERKNDLHRLGEVRRVL